MLFVGLLLIGLLYLLPTFIAFFRKKRNANAIDGVNFFLGWSFIGWVVALCWAVMHEPDRRITQTP
jgi:hypothetical protein